MKKSKKSVNKIIQIVLILTFIMICLGSCGQKTEKTEEKAAPIKVITVSESSYESEAEYFGTIESEKVKRYSFLTGGKIENINVSIGMEVKKSSVLANLEATDFSAAQSNANSTYATAKSALGFAASNFEKMQKLFEEGAISQSELDLALQKRNQAESNYISAEAALNTQNNAMKNTLLRAEEDGIVAAVSFEEGETVGAGVPVVTISSGNQKAMVGISIEDIENLKQGTKVKIVESKPINAETDVRETEGTVKNIGKLPDMTTRTYPVEIEIPKVEFALGSFVNVYIPVGEKTGTVIPISSILEDGESYVYLMGKDKRAEKHNILIKQILDMNAVVEGIQEGAMLITEGMKSIESGRLVRDE